MSALPPNPLRLAIVVPLANESATIAEFLDRTTAQLADSDRIFCVVDNASRDNTRQLVEASAQHDPRVTLVWSPQNRCVVDAYFAGYRAAYDAGAQWILEMDGGLSHDPDQIPQFVALLDKGYDYVGGCRFMPGGGHRGSVKRRLISWLGARLANLSLGTAMRDMTSGFELFSRAAMAHILKNGVQSRANFFQTEIKFALRDWRWTEVPITYTVDAATVRQGSIQEALRGLWRLRRDSRL